MRGVRGAPSGVARERHHQNVFEWEKAFLAHDRRASPTKASVKITPAGLLTLGLAMASFLPSLLLAAPSQP